MSRERSSEHQKSRGASRVLGAAAATITTLGLVLVGPGVAVGAQGSGQNGTANSNSAGSQSAGQSEGNSSASSTGKSSSASQGTSASASKGKGTSASASKGKSASKGTSASASKGKSASKGTSASSNNSNNAGAGGAGKGNAQGDGSNGNQGGGQKEAEGTPPGNNGTVKVAPLGPIDRIPNNTPHPGCNFQIEWYGYDGDIEGGLVSTVTFEMQAPTDGVELTVNGRVSEGEVVALTEASGPGAGNGGLAGSATFTLGFTGEAHEQQGYHVMLTVTTPYSHGNDTKTKVFWVEDCPVTEDTENQGPVIEDTENQTPIVEDTENQAPSVEDTEGDVVAGEELEVEDTTTTGGGGQDSEEVAGVGGGQAGGAEADQVAGVSAEVGGVAGVAGAAGAAGPSAGAGVQVPTQVAAGIGDEERPGTLSALLLALGAALAAAGAWARLGRRFRGVGQV